MQNNEFGNQERLCKKLNYAGFEIEKVCYGFAAKGLEAILLMFLFRKEQKEGKKGGVHHPLKSFDERWRIIENERDTLKSINTKAKMDINAFFQGIMIYHAPYVFKELFEKVLFDGKQDLILSARLAQSRSIEMLGGMQKTLTLSGVYNGLILVLCLKAFREELEFQKIHYPVPLFVHANTHSIVIGYEPAKKNWILIDAERKCVHYMTNDKDMSYAIMLSYIRDYNIKDKIELIVESYLTPAHLDENSEGVSNALQDWESTYETYLGQKEVKWRDFYGSSCLHAATKEGNFTRVDTLIKKGAQINQFDNEGKYPLHFAAEAEHFDIAILLIEHGSIINKIDNEGFSPLCRTAQNGHFYMADLLIKQGALIHIGVDNEVSPLYIAAQNGHFEMVNLLLEKGADVSACFRNYSPLHVASHNGHVELAELLIKLGAIINSRGPYGCSSLHFAAQNGHVDVVKLLIKNGAKVNQCDDDNFSPLYAAAQNDHLEIVKLLLQKGADANSCFDASKSLFPDITEKPIVELLQSHVIKINKKFPQDSRINASSLLFWTDARSNEKKSKNRFMDNQPDKLVAQHARHNSQ